ncbi:MAG: hypothetical protein M1813_004444 [Trichoglossum hirsutum]|nr:MAG: hypothetical protein M1813_004444 [Trichoglossum hirsutum]
MSGKSSERPARKLHKHRSASRPASQHKGTNYTLAGCGYAYSRSNKATMGGVIIVDGAYYGLTVSHASAQADQPDRRPARNNSNAKPTIDGEPGVLVPSPGMLLEKSKLKQTPGHVDPGPGPPRMEESRGSLTL